MALFRKKDEEPQGNGDNGDNGANGAKKPDFEAQPEKAAKWFAHAKTMADSYNYESALVYYANGIKLEPDRMSAHESMYETAVQYANKGGKPAAGKEIRKLEDAHPVSKFAAAEFAWMKDLGNAGLAVKALEAAVKADQLEYGHWAASRVFGQITRTKKSKSMLRQAMELFHQVSAWTEAMATGQILLQMDPTDNALDAKLKNLSAQRAMDQGGYEENVGEEGGFRRMVKDIDKQRELEEADSISGGSVDARNLERAQREYEANPDTPDVLNRYAQLLKKQGTKETAEQAIEIYMKGYEDTSEYRFRMIGGDIRIELARKDLEALADRIEDADNGEVAAGNAEALRTAYTRGTQELQELELSEYRERVGHYPTDRGLKFRLGETELRAENYEGAMACFQAAKDEPKLRVAAGHLLGRCFAAESWHAEAIEEFQESIEAVDVTDKGRELEIRYDLMVSLIAKAREDRSVDLAKDALDICSSIARKDITYRDIRARRKEVDALFKEMS